MSELQSTVAYSATNHERSASHAPIHTTNGAGNISSPSVGLTTQNEAQFVRSSGEGASATPLFARDTSLTQEANRQPLLVAQFFNGGLNAGGGVQAERILGQIVELVRALRSGCCHSQLPEAEESSSSNVPEATETGSTETAASDAGEAQCLPSSESAATPPVESTTAKEPGMEFKEFISELLQPDANDSISEDRLQYGIVSYQLYQKSPELQAQYQTRFDEAREQSMSVREATSHALEGLHEEGKLADWEVDWVYSLSHRAAQLDSSHQGLNHASAESISFEEALRTAEQALVGIQSESITVKDRGPLGVGWAYAEYVAPEQEEE